MANRIDRNAPPPVLPQSQDVRPAATPAATAPSAPANRFEASRADGPVALATPADHVTLPSMPLATESTRAEAKPNAAIADNAKVESTISIDKDLDVTKLNLELGIKHSYKGDLVVTLTSPSGRSAVVHNRTGGSTDDVRGAFDLTAFAGESSKGDWKLTVEDKAKGDVGTLESWALNVTGESKLPPPPPPEGGLITKTATPNTPIEDNKTVTSTIDVAEDTTVDKLKLNLDIAHTYRGDLVVKLTSPSGKSVTVSNKEGGGTDDIKGAFDLAFADEKTKGSWKLEVTDTASQDTGTLKSWGLEITPKGDQPPPPPPPVGEDSDPMTHIKYLSSDEMRGRDTPSPEFDKASEYVRNYLQKYGLEGPNPTDPVSPYSQTFNAFNFSGVSGADQHANEVSLDPSKAGHKLFAHGAYLDETLSAADLKTINANYRAETKSRGELPRQGSGPNGDLTLDELRSAARATNQVQNTLGLLKGTGPHKDEVIVVMAHLDHIGVDSRGQVYNGADDNASGSSVLMASIPELVALQKAGKLDRSVLFVWTAGEEQGLVGSKYFVDHPIPGLGMKEIAGVVNMDMVGRWDDQRLSVIDSNKTGTANYFRDIVTTANTKLTDPFDKINHDIDGYRSRQDGWNFTAKGEDVLMLFEGLSNPNGGGELNPDYHATGDDVDKIIRDNGGNKPRRIKDLFVNIVQLASTRTAAAQQRSTSSAEAPRPNAVMWR